MLMKRIIRLLFLALSLNACSSIVCADENSMPPLVLHCHFDVFIHSSVPEITRDVARTYCNELAETRKRFFELTGLPMKKAADISSEFHLLLMDTRPASDEFACGETSSGCYSNKPEYAAKPFAVVMLSSHRAFASLQTAAHEYIHHLDALYIGSSKKIRPLLSWSEGLAEFFSSKPEQIEHLKARLSDYYSSASQYYEIEHGHFDTATATPSMSEVLFKSLPDKCQIQWQEVTDPALCQGLIYGFGHLFIWSLWQYYPAEFRLLIQELHSQQFEVFERHLLRLALAFENHYRFLAQMFFISSGLGASDEALLGGLVMSPNVTGIKEQEALLEGHPLSQEIYRRYHFSEEMDKLLEAAGPKTVVGDPLIEGDIRLEPAKIIPAAPEMRFPNWTLHGGIRAKPIKKNPFKIN